MKKLLLAAFLILNSCSELVDDTITDNNSNPNAVFYGTEWSTESQNEGLKFLSDNSVLFFSNNASVTKSGNFQYDTSSKQLTFDGLIVTASPSSEFTHAKLTSETTMDVYWHELGKTKGYVTELHKRR